jgi:DNA gyrase subunit A
MTPSKEKEEKKQGDSKEVDSEAKDNNEKTKLEQKKAKKNQKNSKSQIDRQQKIQPSVFSIQRSEQATINITNEDYIYWQNLPSSSQGNGSSLKKGEDFVIESQPINNREQLVIVIDNGKAYPLSIENIPPVEEIPKQTILSLLSKTAQRDAQSTVSRFFLPESEHNLDLVLLTEKGRIKRIQGKELDSLGNRGLALIKLKEQDSLKYACFVREGQEMAIATNGGRILRFPVNDEQLPVMGRSAQGNQALRLRYGESLIGCVAFNGSEDLLLISELGYGKRIPISTLRLANLGDIGTQAMQFTDKTDNLAGMNLAQPKTNIILTVTSDRRLIVPVDKVEFWGKDGTGNKIVNLKSEERIVSIYSQPN